MIREEAAMRVSAYEAFFPDRQSPVMTAHINIVHDDDVYTAKAFYFTRPGRSAAPGNIHKDGHTRSETANSHATAVRKIYEALQLEFGPLEIQEVDD
jgi:hypothetical protein